MKNVLFAGLGSMVKGQEFESINPKLNFFAIRKKNSQN